jgi:hypothetical protein
VFFTNKYFIWLTPLRYISPWPLRAFLRFINGLKRLLSNYPRRQACLSSTYQRPKRAHYCNTRKLRSYYEKVMSLINNDQNNSQRRHGLPKLNDSSQFPRWKRDLEVYLFSKAKINDLDKLTARQAHRKKLPRRQLLQKDLQRRTKRSCRSLPCLRGRSNTH